MRVYYLFIFTFFWFLFLQTDAISHRFTENEAIPLWVNKVGPFRNPQETYLYYSLPFCLPDKIEEKPESLGEALQGYELIKSPVVIQFGVDRPTTSICMKELTPREVETFRYAVRNQYWYQLFLDDLPIWGMVGEVLDGEPLNNDKLYIYTHTKFSISLNGPNIIEVNLTSDNPVLIDSSSKITFTYSVSWHSTNTPFRDRFHKYLDNSFFEHQIHWFSIFNSFMMVIFLTGLVAIILIRTLRKDFQKYAPDLDDFDDGTVGDDSGWKQIHGDVFRPPKQLVLFSALIGTGHQMLFLITCLIFLAIFGTFYRSRGAIATAFIICYAFTSFVGGFGGGGFYKRSGGNSWIKTMLLSASLFPGFCLVVVIVLNSIAYSYQSLSYVPFGTLFAISVIWGFVALPLTLIGSIIGKNYNGESNNPCRTNTLPRQIPDKKWYLKPWVHAVLGGILPFGSIFIEMYFIFTSFWHYKYYYVYGFMLLVYIILIIVSVCVTIVSTYFLLNSEDHRWHWTSFLSSASTAAYVFLYSIYYFIAKTKMSGLLQTAFYFGYMSIFCFALFILCGTIGFIGTSIFVRRIYRILKIE
eukprot:TRINITY_DN180_c3_g1_i1.p1 TRINITY_DN180_c3_g1~~TRINITY_DN180_c3_g1_i1.p1  ORF type:complete len:582 (+),score=176.99 TRINITY_DN180_c3_g1_i1:78-1823(+)